jgi:hypothetical protein
VPLNQKQRDAVRSVRLLKDGWVQAVSGPPGTGKTALLKTLIADAVVNAVVNGSEPPKIMITSANNHAVMNAAKALTAAITDGVIVRERWLPGVTHLAGFSASSQQAKNSGDLMLLEALHMRIFSKTFAEDAEHYFLNRFEAWCLSQGVRAAAPGDTNLAIAKSALQKQLQEVVKTIRGKADLVAKAERLKADGEAISARIADLDDQIIANRNSLTRAEQAAGTAEAEVAELDLQHRTAISMLDHRAKGHPTWMRWFSFLPLVEGRRALLLYENAVALNLLPAGIGRFDSRAQLYMAIDSHFVTRKQVAASRAADLRSKARDELERLKMLQEGRTALELTLGLWKAAAKELEDWMRGHTDPAAADLLDAARRRVDREFRTKAFDLAMRIREAEFLLRRAEWDETWATKIPQGRASRTKLLEAYALVVPCIVATVYKASQRCCFYTGENEKPMDLPIDLLIFDEAGQVASDLGLPLLGIARRAEAVGDVYQLEPIESFNEACDELLLRAAGIDGLKLNQAHRTSLTHTRGSVMRAFQQATAYTDADVGGCGVLLRHHFRCVPKIIAYCNELVYNKKLVCVKAPVIEEEFAALQATSYKPCPSCRFWMNCSRFRAACVSGYSKRATKGSKLRGSKSATFWKRKEPTWAS